VSVYLCISPVLLHTLSPPPPITSPSSFLLALIAIVVLVAFVIVDPRTNPRVSGHPCEDEHRKMRVIKGKIFLCPVIGGCRGNTRATSASNYFQTLRIERALPQTAGIARHIHFSVSPGLSIVTIRQPSSFLQGHPFTPSSFSVCWLLMTETRR